MKPPAPSRRRLARLAPPRHHLQRSSSRQISSPSRCTSMSTMAMAEQVLLNTPHVFSALSPANSRYSHAPPPAAARFWPTPSPRGRGRLGRSLALLLCIAYLSLARPRGEGGAQERARARGRAGAVCCLGADSAGGAGGVQKRRAGRDLGALRERLQAEDEQRDGGSSERRRGRAARLRDSGGTQPPPEVVSPSGRLLPASPLACGHLTLLRQGAF